MDRMREVIGELAEQVRKQAEVIQALKARLDKDSHNSSKPPSQDGYKKPAPKSLRKPGEKANGGQPGHKGHTLKATEPPDHVEEHAPGCCISCKGDLSGVSVSGSESRQVFDLPPMRIEVTEHVAQTKVCPACGTVNCGEFPPKVDAAVQYGDGVTSFCAYLNTQHYIPLDRTTQLFEDMFQHNLSESFVLKANHAVSESVKPAEEAVKTCLVASEILHVDESGIRVKGKLHWIHVASTDKLTHYAVHAKRGAQAMNEMGVIPKFKGSMIHDHWKPYFQFTECDHGACNAHQLRELVGVVESWQQPWAKDMIGVLCDIKGAVDAAKKKGATELPEGMKAKFVQNYEKVLADGYAANPLPPEDESPSGRKGRKKQSPPRNLLDRLRNFQADTLRFMNDFRVPFDNNLSERDIRMIKTKMKVSGAFRTLTGAEEFARIRGYISTARKNGLNILGSIKNALAGKPFIPSVA
ncbi:IS66 family transposase [Patescibacteria group bacterium]|nr:MAG: IS66 family transposase [Patescibacteria group bacterium]